MRCLIVPTIAILFGAGVPAHAEITQCTNITTLPAVISTQGVYCLKQDLATTQTSGAAITINANNVTLDCNDWKVGGLAGGIATDALGVSSGKLNTTIRNCGIRGFRTGINLTGSGGYLVEDNRLDQNTETGMHVRGDSSVIRRNRIMDTGGRPLSMTSVGIEMVNATSTLIADNLITNITVTGNSYGYGEVIGISMASTLYLEIARNSFANLIPTGANGEAYGTLGFSGWEVTSLRDNTAFNPKPTFGTGFDGGSAQSLCSGNRTHGFTDSIEYCIDAGGNAGS